MFFKLKIRAMKIVLTAVLLFNINVLKRVELADNLQTNKGTYIPATLYNGLRQKKQFLPDSVRELGIQMLEGLRTLHRANLVHRDIKPENILYVNGILKLSDVGLVRSLSQSLSLGGTLGFIPPQSLKSSSVSQSKTDDLYALAYVLQIGRAHV